MPAAAIARSNAGSPYLMISASRLREPRAADDLVGRQVVVAVVAPAEESERRGVGHGGDATTDGARSRRGARHRRVIDAQPGSDVGRRS